MTTSYSRSMMPEGRGSASGAATFQMGSPTPSPAATSTPDRRRPDPAVGQNAGAEAVHRTRRLHLLKGRYKRSYSTIEGIDRIMPIDIYAQSVLALLNILGGTGK